jgi:hypothetical protein
LYRHRPVSLLSGARDEQAVAGGDDAGGDAGNLVGRLARPENDFRKALASGAVVIDTRVPQVLERGLAYKLKELVLRGLRRKRACVNRLQERAKLVAGHRPKSLAFVDFPFSRAIKSAIVPRDGFICI